MANFYIWEEEEGGKYAGGWKNLAQESVFWSCTK